MDDQDRETRRQLARIRSAFGSMPYGPAAGIELHGELPTLEQIADNLELLRDCLNTVVEEDMEKNAKIAEMEAEARAVGRFFSRAVNLAAN